MKPCIIFNPVARGEKAQRFRAQVATFAADCVLKPTTGPGAGRALAAEAVREGFDTIVAAGGDGTLNEVLNGLGDSPDGFTKARLGLLPLGTVNVFAKELALPMDVAGAWRIIRAGRDRPIDVAAADFTDFGKPARRYFIQMAGAGLDSRAIELVDWEQKKKFGMLAYIIASAKALRGPLPQIVVTNGHETFGGEFVLVGNGRFYGGRWVLFPQADLADGILEATVFPKVNWPVVARCGLNVLTGQFPAAGQALHLRGARIDFASPHPVPFHVEGENVGHLPATFSILPTRLRVLVP
ncbi:MAG: diacylglycerol kinase family lipid kinase [Verrucomicrobia bacterium]|nr:diacylglycerol kinase family lipid kinase [Verrucomicrobiota bacterium]